MSDQIVETKPYGVIYGLVDPRTEEIRYIGKTRKSLSRRYSKHIREASDTTRSHKDAWIRQLYYLGLQPTVRVLEEIPEGEAELNSAERSWIQTFRMAGVNLTNMTDGGDCGPLPGEANPFFGRHHSEESRKKISTGRRGKYMGPRPAYVGRKISAGKMGHKHADTSKHRASAHRQWHVSRGIKKSSCPLCYPVENGESCKTI
jgi:hypothetical protein